MMFVLLLVLSALCSAVAFAPASSRAASVRGTTMFTEGDLTQALPWSKKPMNLDESLPGYRAFDPWGFTNKLPAAPYLSDGDQLKWYREAEIVHGRVAQLAILGFLVPAQYHFPGSAVR
jgi:light-harvesting complex I chlorophyll a/b binding protein 1